jgi:uncharacterized BrkB/YihY/UPF0761 family membrane protein
VKGMIEHAQKPASGTFALIIRVMTLLFGASGVFGELRSALNKIWDVSPTGKVGSGSQSNNASFLSAWSWPLDFSSWSR